MVKAEQSNEAHQDCVLESFVADIWARSPLLDSGWVTLSKSSVSAGSVRCSEAVDSLPGQFDMVVNIQGDEPLIEPSVIDETVRALQESPDINYRSAAVTESLV